jgi:hypothetical protein
MARTLRTYRLFLTEFQNQVVEIGQLVKPFQTSFNFDKIINGYQSNFSDDSKNKISVYFYTMEKERFGYEIDFSVNGTSIGNDRKMDLKLFLPIVSTVVSCINAFIEKFNPPRLYIAAAEKSGRVEQKQKIWREYVLQNIKDTGFVVGNAQPENGYLILQNNTHPDIIGAIKNWRSEHRDGQDIENI